MNITCAICDKPLNRYYAMRVGGIVEQITGKRFMCRECVKQMQKEGWIDTRRGER